MGMMAWRNGLLAGRIQPGYREKTGPQSTRPSRLRMRTDQGQRIENHCALIYQRR